MYVKEYISKNMSINKTVDFRIFLIPNRINTLSNYLAMHDDLYCQFVYLAFSQNPLFPYMSKASEEQGRLLNLMDDSI